MESQTVVLLGYVLVLVLLAGLIGYMFGSSRTNARFRRRDVGKVVGSDLTFVLHDLDHSIKHDRNGREVVALQGSRYRTFEDDRYESFYLSLTVEGGAAAADLLYEVYRAGAVHCTLRRFERGQNNQPT